MYVAFVTHFTMSKKSVPYQNLNPQYTLFKCATLTLTNKEREMGLNCNCKIIKSALIF